mgnify:CR=1 FL=1
MEISADRGLNVVELRLETDESFKDLLDDEQKEDYEEYKKKEGDSDLFFNEKDNKKKIKDKE